VPSSGRGDEQDRLRGVVRRESSRPEPSTSTGAGGGDGQPLCPQQGRTRRPGAHRGHGLRATTLSASVLSPDFNPIAKRPSRRSKALCAHKAEARGAGKRWLRLWVQGARCGHRPRRKRFLRALWIPCFGSTVLIGAVGERPNVLCVAMTWAHRSAFGTIFGTFSSSRSEGSPSNGTTTKPP
jgi:hypothetical protein